MGAWFGWDASWPLIQQAMKREMVMRRLIARIMDAIAGIDIFSGGACVVKGGQVVVVGQLQVICQPKLVRKAMQIWCGGQNGVERVSVQMSVSQ